MEKYYYGRHHKITRAPKHGRRRRGSGWQFPHFRARNIKMRWLRTELSTEVIKCTVDVASTVPLRAH